MRLRAHRKLETVVAFEVDNRVFAQEPPPLFDTHSEGIAHALRQPIGGARTSERRLRTSGALSASFYSDRDGRSVKWSLMLVPKGFREHLEKHENPSSRPPRIAPMVKNRRADPRGTQGGGGPVPRIRSSASTRHGRCLAPPVPTQGPETGEPGSAKGDQRQNRQSARQRSEILIESRISN